MLDKRPCTVNTAVELDAEIRDILALQHVQRADQICGTLYVNYTDESVKTATLIPALEQWGVTIVFRKA